MLQLLRQYFLPFTGGWPWLSYLGLGCLLLALVTGFFSPSAAFALGVVSYILLLCLPFMLAPKVWRVLISNRQLVLTPGFARTATLAAFLFTLLQAIYLNVFAALYVTHGSPLRQTALMFINASLYMGIMQYAVTTTWAVIALSIMPALSIASLLFIMQGLWRMLGDDHLLWLTIACVLGWLLVWRRVGLHHHFRSQHSSVVEIRDWQNPRAPVAQWLVNDSDAQGSATVSLLLGYPANLSSRLRVLGFNVFFGPLVATAFLTLLRFGQDWEWNIRPTALEILLGCSLFPATFGAFQHVDWVARLRLFWLRGRLQRSQMWLLLERQLLINATLLLVLCTAVAASGLLFSQLSAQWLLHYPLLVLSFNAFYTYYMICARIGCWSHAWGLALAFAGSTIIYGAWLIALRSGSTLWLYGLELLTLSLAWYLRPRAKRMLDSIDWLRVRPTCLAKLAN